MKKFLALCLTIIMVISVLAVPALAVTVEVPEKTLVDQSFVGLTAVPDGWKVSGACNPANEDGTSAWAGGITQTETGTMSARTSSAIDAGKADYTVTVKGAHYQNMYIHIGAQTTANATAKGAAATGYTIHSKQGYKKSDGTTDYTNATLSIYEGTELLATAGSVKAGHWYQGNPETATWTITVTDEKITLVAGGTTLEAQLTNDAVKSGYIGVVNDEYLNLSKSKIVSVSAVASAYSYNVENTQATTGAYAVTGQEYVESHTGTMYFDYDFTASTTAPAGVTANGGTFGDAQYGYKCSGDYTVNLGNYTTADNVIIEASVNALPWSNDHIFTFLGYELHLDPQPIEGTTNYNPRAILTNSADPSFEYIWDGKASNRKGPNTLVPVVFKLIDGKITVTINNLAVFTDIDDLSEDLRTRSGDVKVRFNWVNGGGKMASIKMYSADYADTSSYVDVKKTNFLLDKTFTANDTTESLNADGFTSIKGAPSANGISGTTRSMVAYTGVKLGGSYTLEVAATKPYSATYVKFNNSADGCYTLTTNQSGYSNGQGTGNIKLTKTGVDEALFDVTAFPNINGTKVVYTIILNETDEGALDITVKVGGTTIATVTDETPLTSGTFSVENVAESTTTTVHSVKAYPTSVATPAYEGNFDIGGSVASAAAKGNTYFTFPVTMLGQSPDFIAALYEDNALTDIKLYDVDEINEGAVALFDTTDSTASKVEIKVFVWDSLEGMVPVLNPFILD